jgi:Fic family protein|tara:strand:+ start:32 stop:319 length:288 start_codon:yes stop_codon:yes gene_type:complete
METILNNELRFNGATYDPILDKKRLTSQVRRIYSLMIDGKWRTLQEIEEITKCPQASISAQLRHLRKARFGSNTVNKKRNAIGSGLYEYQLLNEQ